MTFYTVPRKRSLYLSPDHGIIKPATVKVLNSYGSSEEKGKRYNV